MFEFCLRELRLRTLAHQPGRRLSALGWLYPAERLRVQLCMATDQQNSAETATRQVRVTCAARRLYRLRTALAACDQPVRPGRLAARRVRRAERRAQGALARAGFADPAIAAAVLRHVQVLTVTAALARLDYRTADAAHVRRHETAVTAKRTGRTLAGATRTASPTFGTCPSHCTRPGADVAGW